MPPFITDEALESDRIRHRFFGRRGGVSTGLYDSLNVGVGSDDDPNAVEANREIVRASLEADHLLSCYQVHGVDVVHVTETWTERPKADAMVTDRPGLALCILTADCAPILFADAEAGVIGAAHAGWKGAVAGVAEACIAAMEKLGARRENISAVIGPCIHQDSYEVGPEFRESVLAAWAGAETFFRPGAGDRLHFDLPGFLVERLKVSGISNGAALPFDTCALENDYFSNRRRNHAGEPDYGRNASVIMLRGLD